MNNNQNRRPPERNGAANPSQRDPRTGAPRQGNPNNPPRRQNSTAGQRQSGAGNAPRRPLTPEEEARRREYIKRKRAAEEARRRAELEEERRIAREKARRKEMKKRERKKNAKIFGGRFIVFLAVFVILCIITGVLFAIHFTSTPDAPDDSGTITYYYGGSEVRKAPADEVITTKAVYFCMNDLASYLGMAQSGDAEGLKFIIKSDSIPATDSSGSGDEQIAVFHTNLTDVTLGGQVIHLETQNILRGEEIWVSSDFISEYMVNLSFDYNEKKADVHISKIKDEVNSDDDVTVYLPVSFKLHEADVIPPVDNPDGTPHAPAPETDPPETEPPVVEPVYELNFKTDLSAYEKYMDPEDRDGYLILVNTKNHLSSTDVPPDLTAPKYRNWENKTLREYAARALEALFIEFEAAGFTNSNLAIRSTYREYANQAYLFEYYTQRELTRDPSLTREEAEKIVLTFSTRPGTSEHQSGLAVDMDTTGTLVTDFQYTAEYKWLSENAWKFGFILRFPDGKMDITTIQFEPWHYRYVGRYHAKKIYDSGLCLEEYLKEIGIENNY